MANFISISTGGGLHPGEEAQMKQLGIDPNEKAEVNEPTHQAPPDKAKRKAMANPQKPNEGFKDYLKRLNATDD